MSVSKDHSTIHTTAKVNGTTTRTTGPKDGMVAQVQSPAKRFTGKEGNVGLHTFCQHTELLKDNTFVPYIEALHYWYSC